MSHFQQPDNLTKERLKDELKKNGVRFDQNENKDYYVRFYHNKVLQAGGHHQRSKFFGGRKQPAKKASWKHCMAMVTRLTDEELEKELRNRKEKPGPVMDTTREVYQRKLAKPMAESAKIPSKSHKMDTTDYATDHVEEWSSQSSEEKDEEEEEEAGAVQEPASMRHATAATSPKTLSTQRMAFATLTRHVKPQETKRKGGSARTPQVEPNPYPQAPPAQAYQSDARMGFLLLYTCTFFFLLLLLLLYL